MKLIATFYSHFGAVRFGKQCREMGCSVKLSPVPRDLSSSCGTCAKYEFERMCPIDPIPEEIEQIVEIVEEGYNQLYRAKNS